MSKLPHVENLRFKSIVLQICDETSFSWQYIMLSLLFSFLLWIGVTSAWKEHLILEERVRGRFTKVLCIHTFFLLPITDEINTWVYVLLPFPLRFSFFWLSCKLVVFVFLLAYNCQPKVLGINSTQTGIPNLGCGKEGNFMQCLTTQL